MCADGRYVTYEDQIPAIVYRTEFATFCYDSLEDPESCTQGSLWSIIYRANGSILFLYSCAMVIIVVGMTKPLIRCVGVTLMPILGLCPFGILVASLVYRYRHIGMLCALSDMPTNFVSWSSYDDTWTYRKDAERIASLLLLQSLTQCMCCTLGMTPCVVPRSRVKGHDQN